MRYTDRKKRQKGIKVDKKREDRKLSKRIETTGKKDNLLAIRKILDENKTNKEKVSEYENTL